MLDDEHTVAGEVRRTTPSAGDTQPGSFAALEPTDVLSLPHLKRISHVYSTDESGTRELRIFYGSKEISFDDERLFAFGERLIAQPSFTAREATSWGGGYDWQEVRALLETLLEEGIIKRGELAADPRTGSVPSLLPRSVCPVPRSWSAATCEAITRELGGRPIEIGNLEAIIPAYRIPHPALDLDGRQVGEANVFPPGLRLDRDTEWRTCQYAGSRYRDDAPMNVTALKAMTKHWRPMLAAILEVRDELLRRIERSRAGWTVGDLHTFARVVLSVPAYQLMTGPGASPQPPLHPVWSSALRITDGIRMTTHDMLFLSAERTRRPEEEITAHELYEFTEHNGLFLSRYGVCAGPKAMIDQFFALVFDGTAAEGSGQIEQAPEVHALLSQLPAAVDYGLLGLQVWGVSRSVWTAMSRVYAALRDLFAGPIGDARTCVRLRARLDHEWREIERERLSSELELEVHQTVYADAYEQAWRGLRAPVGPPTLAARIAPGPEGSQHLAARSQLRDHLTTQFGDIGFDGKPLADRVAGILIDYLREEQAILAGVTQLQAEINERLDRPRPERPLTIRDLHSMFAMSPLPMSRFPYVLDTFEDELGLRVFCTAGTLEVTAPTRCTGNSAGGQ